MWGKTINSTYTRSRKHTQHIHIYIESRKEGCERRGSGGSKVRAEYTTQRRASKQNKVMSSDGDKNKDEEKQRGQGQNNTHFTSSCSHSMLNAVNVNVVCMHTGISVHLFAGVECREEKERMQIHRGNNKASSERKNRLDTLTYIGNGACSPNNPLHFLDLGETISTITCTL